MKLPSALLYSTAVLAMAICKAQTVNKPEASDGAKIAEYWSSGAEITSYALKQMRYGEEREGQAVLVFVREPFLEDEQVKDESGGEGVPTLKLNKTRNFLTGIYPYSTMVSTFHPMTNGQVGAGFKVTTSVQEWCGHVFMQTNRRPNGLITEVASYFEKEEDTRFQADNDAYLEDEIFTAIRLAPKQLPVGNFEMIPGSLYTRLKHLEPVPTNAVGDFAEAPAEDLVRYEVTYPQIGRRLTIDFQREHPFAIEAWYEQQGEEISSAKKVARLTQQEYWRQNSVADEGLRKKLKLSTK